MYTDHFVMMNSWYVYSEEFVDYYDLIINGEVKMLAFYKDVRNAMKAAQIHCLTQVAKIKEPEKIYPDWINRYIQKRAHIESTDETQPKFNGIVFVSNLHTHRNFFGYLDLDSPNG